MDNEKKSVFSAIDTWLQDHGFKAKVEEEVETPVETPETEVAETEEKFETVLLADGETEATIEPAVEVGAAIVLTSSDGTPVAAPVGEYELQDGRVVVVAEEGVVAEVRDAEVSEEPLSEDAPEEASQVKRLIERIEKEKIFEKVAELETALEESQKESKFLKEENEALTEKFAEFDNSVKELLNDIKALVGAEPSKEPAVETNDPLAKFRSEESGNYLLANFKPNE